MRTLSLYAIVRFMPFADTQEFTNIGVVLCAPDQGKFTFLLACERFPRVTQFFENLDGKLYTQARNVLEQELKRIEAYIANHPGEKAALIFEELTRHREGITYFSNTRRALFENPTLKLNELYEHYVHRDPASDKHRGEAIENRIHQIFTEHKIKGFRKATLVSTLGDFELPFVRESASSRQIIKPLAFEQGTPLGAFERAKKWTDRFVRLRNESQVLQKNMLFVLDSPKQKLYQAAYTEAVDILSRLNISHVDVQKHDELVAFAKQ